MAYAHLVDYPGADALELDVKNLDVDLLKCPDECATPVCIFVHLPYFGVEVQNGLGEDIYIFMYTFNFCR